MDSNTENHTSLVHRSAAAVISNSPTQSHKSPDIER